MASEIAGVGVLGILLIAGVMTAPITFIIVVIANRADPDPTGARPMAAFFFGGAFLTLWLTVIGVLTSIMSLVALIGKNQYFSFGGGPKHPFGDAAARGVTIGMLIVIVAGLLHEWHLRRGLALAEGDTVPGGPSKRLARSYVAVTSFVSIVIVIVSLIVLCYSIFGLIAPGVYESGSRTGTFKLLLDDLAVLLVTLTVFVRAQALAPQSLRLRSRGGGRMSSVETVPAPAMGGTTESTES